MKNHRDENRAILEKLYREGKDLPIPSGLEPENMKKTLNSRHGEGREGAFVIWKLCLRRPVFS